MVLEEVAADGGGVWGWVVAAGTAGCCGVPAVGHCGLLVGRGLAGRCCVGCRERGVCW